ncbi:MAG: hypothetical protein EAZ30_15845 [Betaproteobacteria bacterium]|nr:MAG: hypothetical protein EAZ30_15845 [Betaproteobacteria bacterium]
MTMDRLFLTQWGMALSDDEFAQALAALGMLEGRTDGDQSTPHLAADAAAGRGTRIQWRLTADTAATSLSAQQALSAWRHFHGARQRPYRFTVAGQSIAAQTLWAAWLRRITDVDAVCIAPSPALAGAAQWKLPFTVSALEGDSIAEPFRVLRQFDPPDWPFEFVAADRNHDRCEILFISESVAAALTTLLASGLRIRARFVIIAGLGNDSIDSAWPLLSAIAARVSAAGIGLIDTREALAPRSIDETARQLNAMCFELSHNAPIDAAFALAFGRNATLYANAEFIAASQTSAQIEKLAERLEQMPASAAIDLGEPAVHRLTKRAGPPPSPQPANRALRSAIMASAGDFAFAHESGEAAAMADLSTAMRSTAARVAAESRPARFVQQQCFGVSDTGPDAPNSPLLGALVKAQPVLLRIRIGENSDAQWMSSTASFPEDKLPISPNGHRLQVMFFEPQQLDEPMVKDIHLPSVGASSEAEFLFTPRAAGDFEARISIVHRGRILQTALLRTVVVASREAVVGSDVKMTLTDEALVRHDWTSLDQRRRFDLALVFNHDVSNTPRMTALSDRRAWAKDLSTIDDVVKAINVELSAVATNVVDFADGLDKGENPKLFVTLAMLGTELFTSLIREQIEPNTTGDIDFLSDAITHIQIVSTRSDAIVPIEFVYDYGMPDDAVAKLCPEHRDALKSGHCKRTCPGRKDPTQHVCPMGFWGIRKVIERHVFSAKQNNPDGAAFILQSEATAQRSALAIHEDAVIGYSEIVKQPRVKPLIDALKLSVHGAVVEAENWDEWAAAVAKHTPQLLVAFPHHAGTNINAKLEIGKQAMSTLRLVRYGDPISTPGGAPLPVHVRMPNTAPPLVLLLGCDVSSTAQQFGSHVRDFRAAGAAIVVSTVATVFGEHAVAVGTAMVKRLIERAEADASNDQFGEILRDTKRQALLDSLPMALCVVAYGDADWTIAPKH